MKRRSIAAVPAIAIALGLLLTGCSSPTGGGAAGTKKSVSAAPSKAAKAAEGTQPKWALKATASGTKLTSFDVGGARVDVYQAGTFTASNDVPGAGKTGVNEGDELVLLNVVVTNTGEPVELDGNVAEVTATYTDHPDQDMSGLLDDDAFTRLGVNREIVDHDKHPARPYLLATGDVVSRGVPFKYLKGEPIELTGFLTLADYDATMPEGHGTATLK
ncbi:hypothetical protein [Schumannella soli]|uniref:Uncharacterized protein n=1 Tax=Schumannella soli TaxID=2590779 RepID=A0A506Y6Q2_9MICO|nr:hypothetical protein [Schumannella soli]TPW77543.1 hypothetical protein FJ657_02365 [Schumannella soli]